MSAVPLSEKSKQESDRKVLRFLVSIISCFSAVVFIALKYSWIAGTPSLISQIQFIKRSEIFTVL